LDVHAPHQPIHGWKDFTVHLVTITIGLLIAVGIEGLVELHREHTLVKEARAMLREEIKSNTQPMKDALDGIAKQKADLAIDVAFLKRIQANPKDESAQRGSMNATFQLKGFDATAWKTAQATNALSYMPYSEAEKYASLYGFQSAFESKQDEVVQNEITLLSMITSFGDKDLTSEQAGRLLELLGRWQAQLGFLELSARLSYEDDEAFLQGKEGPHSEHMDLSPGK
jgi:hypothetical protein